MVTADPQSPVTKKDISMLMQEMGRLYDANEKWKEEVKEHFDLVAENLVHDFLGAHKDDIENIKIRVRRLENHTGLAHHP